MLKGILGGLLAGMWAICAVPAMAQEQEQGAAEQLVGG